MAGTQAFVDLSRAHSDGSRGISTHTKDIITSSPPMLPSPVAQTPAPATPPQNVHHGARWLTAAIMVALIAFVATYALKRNAPLDAPPAIQETQESVDVQVPAAMDQAQIPAAAASVKENPFSSPAPTRSITPVRIELLATAKGNAPPQHAVITPIIAASPVFEPVA